MAIINDVEKDIDCSDLVLQRQKELKEELLKLSSNQTSTPVPCLDQNNIAKGKDLGKLDTLGQLSSFCWKPGENNQGSQQATPFQRQSESRSDQEHQENERATKKCCTIM
ncbi:hypothetical protein Psal027_03715 (plasmid) [Piscirickettsia salmonis]|uniref:hypothetical protein n=1 Tax=Piscirickettsia salmonis TaxID=1238 RepID=UPI000332C05A|nr:hypothetical protein [Piscirickettsia salmonis]ERL60855.1 hypothetical protein K661_02820 [Piscirickettsia salmonis LF-89 = ATCC VR-1361]PEQ17732.1 hypothetical protein X973_00500 [Piscirickettsia salmonis]QGN79404.1 hypothetical protein Psal001_03669 [Piscirickettsia salmonis]QGN82994.1 hypothetical protein Psal002_03694 [Piscirickettsia salmonis]QGN86508.1 hypothetical protein Psal003_03617 [Piscirickettsia salmonis]